MWDITWEFFGCNHTLSLRGLFSSISRPRVRFVQDNILIIKIIILCVYWRSVACLKLCCKFVRTYHFWTCFLLHHTGVFLYRWTVILRIANGCTLHCVTHIVLFSACCSQTACKVCAGWNYCDFYVLWCMLRVMVKSSITIGYWFKNTVCFAYNYAQNCEDDPIFGRLKAFIGRKEVRMWIGVVKRCVWEKGGKRKSARWGKNVLKSGGMCRMMRLFCETPLLMRLVHHHVIDCSVISALLCGWWFCVAPRLCFCAIFFLHNMWYVLSFLINALLCDLFVDTCFVVNVDDCFVLIVLVSSIFPPSYGLLVLFFWICGCLCVFDFIVCVCVCVCVYGLFTLFSTTLFTLHQNARVGKPG